MIAQMVRLISTVLVVMMTHIGAQADTRDWSREPDRTWIGPEYFANRLQDWRLRDGRVECITSSERLPVRTLHVLTRSIRPTRQLTLDMEVTLGAVDDVADANAASWAGFLVGAGGRHVDYRLTALVHHRPAEDGGLLVVVDGTGRVAFRDNTRGAARGGLWSIAGPLGEGDAPEIDVVSRDDPGVEDGPRGPIRLRLQVRPGVRGEPVEATAFATDPAGDLVSTATARLDPAALTGGLALVSHLGPAASDAGFWFRDWSFGVLGGTITHDERRFGPVLSTMYTISRGVLKLTAQMGPLGPDDARTALLEGRDESDDTWNTVGWAQLVEDSCTFAFRVEDWDASRNTPYRVAYDMRDIDGKTETCFYEGTIRAEPDDGEFVLAAFTGNKIYTGGLKWNHDGIWFPHADLVAAVQHHDPDLLYFSGDQIYEGDLTGVVRAPVETAILDYLSKWYRWCWAFRDLTRHTPCVTIPDDHDVYHGNLWGAGGRRAVARDGMTAQDSGGYRMPARFVNAVHATQTSHLPDPDDPAPVQQDISVYYTSLEYGGVSFAILADRQWKSSPTVAVPAGAYVNGWSQTADFDPVTEADVPDAVLLGPRQLDFLDRWGRDWSNGTWMKVALSQSIFANLATLPKDAKSGSVIPNLPTFGADEYPVDYRLTADADSNGWPQGGRDRAVRAFRRALAMHVAGDQHLGATIQYGTERWGDAGYAFSTPSIANTWPRRWYPPSPGAHRDAGTPRYCGDFLDGFGNRMTVWAVANPIRTGRKPSRLYDRAPGYGIVRFDRATRDITIECWPRWVDAAAPDAMQYPGWPIRFNQLDNAGQLHEFLLRPIFVRGLTDPVVQVVDEATAETLYTVRINGSSFRPWVERPGRYTVHIGEPGTSAMRTLTGLLTEDARPPIVVEFSSP